MVKCWDRKRQSYDRNERESLRGSNLAKRWDRKRQKVTVLGKRQKVTVLGQKQTESIYPKTEIRKKVITEEAIWQSIGTEIDRR